MGATARKDLYLSVDGGITSAFTAAMKAGRSTLADFGKGAESSAQAVRDAFTKLGGGDIADAAKQMEANFNRSFAAIRANAKKVVDAPTNIAAFDILSAQATRDGVANAELRVNALREVANAARAAATGDASGDQRAYAVAADANVVAAERVMAAERAKLGVLEAVEAQMHANGLGTREEAAAQEAQAKAAEDAAMRRQAVAVEEAAEQARLVDRSEALLRSTNPLYGAQARYNEALAEANALREAGVLTAEQYAMAEADAAAKLRAVADAAGVAAEKQRELYATQAASARVEVEANRFQDAIRAADEVGLANKRAAESFEVFKAAKLATTAEEDAAALDLLAKRADALRASIDPAVAAQQRFDREMLDARGLVSAGAIGLDEYCAKLRIERGLLDEAAGASGRAAGGHNRMGIAGMEAEHVVRALSDSVAAGRSPMAALGMEIGRISEAMTFWAASSGATTGVIGKLAGFMGGPWGLAISVGIAVLGPLVGKLIESGDEAEQAKKKLSAYASYMDELGNFVDRATGKLIEQNRALAEGARLLKEREAHGFAQDVGTQKRSAFDKANELAVTGVTFVERGQSIKNYDPQISKVIADAAGNLPKLLAGLKQLATDNPTKYENVYRSVLNIGSQALKSYADYRRATGEAGELATVIGGGTVLSTKIIDRQVLEASAVTALEKAQARLNAVKERAVQIDAMLAGPAKDRALAQYRRDETAAQAAVRAVQADKRTAADDRQSGRQISLGDAENIVTGIGGRITSAVRSRSEQQVLYDRYIAYKDGRGPWAPLAAKPGTSNHETGNALDIAMTPGMSLAKITEAFRAEGVHLTERLIEGNHFHVAWGKKGPSQETLDKRATAAEHAIANEDKSFESDMAAANARIAHARLALADTTENRLAVDLDELAYAKTARDREIADGLKAGKYGDPKTKVAQDRAAQLTAANAVGFTADVDLAKKKASDKILDRQLGIMRDELTGQISILQLQGDLALTNKGRLALARQVLDREEQLARATLAEQIAKEDDPAKRAALQGELANVTPDFALRRQQADRQYADPMAKYKLSLRESAGDMDSSLKGVEVDGLKGLQDGLMGVLSGTKTVAQGFRDMAASIIADLEKIAIEKLLLSVLGLKDGGPAGSGSTSSHDSLFSFLHLATGGAVFGAGGPRDDRVPALLSHGEYVVNAAAYARHPELVQAINSGRLPRFADGGPVGPIFYPELPSGASVARTGGPPVQQHFHINAQGAVLASDLMSEMRNIGVAAMVGGAHQAAQDMTDTSLARIP